jgi:hypothetical protein
VRRLFTWVAGAAGGVAAYRAATRRRPAAEAVPAEADPVQELRAKLAEARSEPEPVTAEPAGPDDPDARRRDVHEQARAALDAMRGDQT